MEPINGTTGEEYQGKNAQTLAAHTKAGGYEAPIYLTFLQALNIGRCVRKGEHGVRICKVIETKDQADGTGRTRRGMRGYTVFNLAQTDPLPVEAQAVAS